MELTKSHNKKNAPISVPKTTESFFSFGKGHGVATPFFQPKLTINTPGDVYEQQADAMAEQVMSQTAFTPKQIQTTTAPPIQYTQSDEDGFRKEEQDCVTDTLAAEGDNLMENSLLSAPFVRREPTVVERKVDNIEKENELQRKEVDEKAPLNLLPVQENIEVVISRKETGNTAGQTATKTVEQALAAPGNFLEDEPKKPLIEIHPSGKITHGYSDEGW